MKKHLLILSAFALALSLQSTAQTSVSKTIDKKLYSSLKWRSIGPYRGGRSIAVAGHTDQPLTYYFGATGGGVWKTINGGEDWASISDSTFTSSSVGAICVAPSDPNTIYVGMGEPEIRGNISFGDGVYKSTDAGKTWRHMGLTKSFAIGKIVVNPKDANIVYVAALGKVFGKNEERGVYRSKDGGENWELVLKKDNQTGACDIQIDPTNSNVLYASLWQCYRNNFEMSSGGEGSGMYKSVDGGTTWKNISKNPGLPVGLLGKIGLAVSYQNGNRVWAIVENKNGGIYRSEDAGETWAQVNTDKNLRQRPWYYSVIAADPGNYDGLYVCNVGFWKTADGGKTSTQFQVPHGDTHDVWVDPKNPSRMILADDGSASVSTDAGKTWTDIDVPTAQIYHVSVDNDFPYHIYGAQQDNTALRIKSRNPEGGSITKKDWDVVAGGESGYIVSDPTNSDIVYGGSYMGYLAKMNMKTGEDQNISPNPITYLGAGSEDMKFRFQWTYPIVFSPHNPKIMYITSQYVHKTMDGGQSWEVISPILTRNDTNTLKSSGGPITKDNTGAETFSDIFTFAESPVQAGVFYAGSDDGWLHVSKDNGKNWTKLNVTGLGEWAMMSLIEPSHYEAGTAYLAANRYKLDDTKPYLFKTSDFGKTWKLITEGLPATAYCRAIREDPNKKGLLYAGTEMGIFVSFNDGENWQPLQQNLPLTPVHDIAIQKRDHDLVVATHGRSFWVLDNLDPLYQIMDNKDLASKKSYLFTPEPTYRTHSRQERGVPEGQNAPAGVLVNYFLKDKPTSETNLVFLNEKRDTVIKYSSTKDKKGKSLEINKSFYQKEKIERPGIISAEAGLNTFEWDMRYADATDVDGGALMWSGSIAGPKVAPGKYIVQLLQKDSFIMEQPFEVKKDPRISGTNEDIAESVKLQLKVRDKLSETHQSINDLRSVRKQVTEYVASVKDSVFKKELEKISKPMVDSMKLVEDKLIQSDAKAFQDLLALPVRLNDQLAGIASVAASADTKPTSQTYQVYDEIAPQIDANIKKLDKIIASQVYEFNKLVDSKRTPAIKLETKPLKP